jgi:hypothetical protein
MSTNSKIGNELELKIARAVQKACIEAASKTFEDASISGLCDEGALEAAIGAIEMLDIDALLGEIRNQ